MELIRDPQVLARMREAFELYELAENMMRQNLRRRFPEEDEAAIERRVLAWLRQPPSTDPAFVVRPGGLEPARQ
jgi:Xaa-Pro aminopeptidase